MSDSGQQDVLDLHKDSKFKHMTAQLSSPGTALVGLITKCRFGCRKRPIALQQGVLCTSRRLRLTETFANPLQRL